MMTTEAEIVTTHDAAVPQNGAPPPPPPLDADQQQNLLNLYTLSTSTPRGLLSFRGSSLLLTLATIPLDHDGGESARTWSHSPRPLQWSPLQGKAENPSRAPKVVMILSPAQEPRHQGGTHLSVCQSADPSSDLLHCPAANERQRHLNACSFANGAK